MLLTAVDEEETDELEEMDDAELDREMVFRGIKTPLTSSEFMEFKVWLPLSPHAGRLIFAKLGGLATAVITRGLRRCSRSSYGDRGGVVATGIESSRLAPCMIALRSRVAVAKLQSKAKAQRDAGDGLRVQMVDVRENVDVDMRVVLRDKVGTRDGVDTLLISESRMKADTGYVYFELLSARALATGLVTLEVEMRSVSRF